MIEMADSDVQNYVGKIISYDGYPLNAYFEDDGESYGSTSHGDKVIEAIGEDWILVRDVHDNTELNLLQFFEGVTERDSLLKKHTKLDD